jgi:hypothetical protein
MSVAGRPIRKPDGLLVAMCLSNVALWGLLMALVLAILSSGLRPLDVRTLVALPLAMLLIVFPAGSMIVWNYRAVFRRDGRAAEAVARVLLFFGFFAALIAVLLSVGFVTAAITSWGENVAHFLVPLVAWMVAAYLLGTGNRYLTWAHRLESDLQWASPEERVALESAVGRGRMSMREMFLAMTVACIVVAVAVSLQRALFR